MDIHESILNTKVELRDLIMQDWKQNDLFSLRWWGTLAFIIIYYIVFIRLLDKKRTSKILLFGCLMCIASFTYDLYGAQFVFWSYLSRLTPVAPSIFIQSFTVIPLTYMIVYQYGHKWGKFLLLNAIATLAIALGFMPLLGLLDIYENNNGWQYVYNIPPFFISACIARALTLWWVNSEQKNKERK